MNILNRVLYLKSFVLVVLFSMASAISSHAQILDPTDWKFSVESLGNNTFLFKANVKIDKGWHVYAQHLDTEDGPIPTTYSFNKLNGVEWLGEMEETPKAEKVYDATFEATLALHEKKVLFSRKFKWTGTAEATLSGYFEFMVCDEGHCLPPTKEKFKVKLPAMKAEAQATTTPPAIEKPLVNQESSVDAVVKPSDNKVYKTVDDSLGLFAIFIAGFLGGLAALLMPCIFPMFPLTVSYFTKRGEGKKKKNPVLQSALYGISIIVIYTGLGLLITLVFGSNALNKWSSSGVFNLFFFALLVVFAFSFLGAFEITLPNSWQNYMDKKSDGGGLFGLFFMAFALVLVSFSCTGPIIGTLLVQAVSSGSLLGPATGMFGFSLALALPFTLFAMFPSWLKKLPKSGGWLNKVKVTLGFLELAFSLKFLSNVDLAYHWDFLDRDIYIIVWLAVFFVMGLYLLGAFKMPGDRSFSDKPKETIISVFQLFIALFAFGFVFYLLPGLWGAPLKGIGGWLPPMYTQDYVVTSGGVASGSDEAPKSSTHKNAGLFHAPYGIDAYFDYQEALDVARRENKPLFVDFTGHSCVNCRKMEASVWSDKEVLKRLKNDYIVVSLYVDDKTDLPKSEQYVSKFSGQDVETIGDKWSDFQAERFGSNSQPYYVLLDTNEKMLAKPHAFDLNVQHFISFLDKGVTSFK